MSRADLTARARAVVKAAAEAGRIPDLAAACGVPAQRLWQLNSGGKMPLRGSGRWTQTQLRAVAEARI